MFDPLTNLSAMLGMLLEILGTTLTALTLPFTSLIIVPLLEIVQLFL